MLIGPLEDTSDAELKVRKSSKFKLKKDGSKDDPFRKKKFKKLGLELYSETKDQAKVDSIAKKSEAKRKTRTKKIALDQSMAVQQGKNLLVNTGYIPQVLFIEPGTEQGESVCDDQTQAKKLVTKKEVLILKVQKTDESKIESRKKVASKVQTRSSVRIEIKSKPGKNFFSK